MLPALSGILPDSIGDNITFYFCAERSGHRQHAGGSGQNARAPR